MLAKLDKRVEWKILQIVGGKWKPFWGIPFEHAFLNLREELNLIWKVKYEWDK